MCELFEQIMSNYQLPELIHPDATDGGSTEVLKVSKVQYNTAEIRQMVDAWLSTVKT